MLMLELALREPLDPKASVPALTAVPPEKKINYTSTAASDVLEAACKQAAKESKLIFVKSGFPKCVWCRIFDLENELS